MGKVIKSKMKNNDYQQPCILLPLMLTRVLHNVTMIY